ncbi:MAG TPA: hypothetical protein VM029_04630 [Opitutaceae bacterium]|nr:hypothetical protein [Opitutaceae bacterium]
MNLPEADRDFLRALVKSSRQRLHHVAWVDRDGSKRITTLTAADAGRLHGLARQLAIGNAALLREAAHLPAVERPPTPGTIGPE